MRHWWALGECPRDEYSYISRKMEQTKYWREYLLEMGPQGRRWWANKERILGEHMFLFFFLFLKGEVENL